MHAFSSKFSVFSFAKGASASNPEWSRALTPVLQSLNQAFGSSSTNDETKEQPESEVSAASVPNSSSPSIPHPGSAAMHIPWIELSHSSSSPTLRRVTQRIRKQSLFVSNSNESSFASVSASLSSLHAGHHRPFSTLAISHHAVASSTNSVSSPASSSSSSSILDGLQAAIGRFIAKKRNKLAAKSGSMEEPLEHEVAEIIHRCIPYLRKYWKHISLSFACSALGALTEGSLAVGVKYICDAPRGFSAYSAVALAVAVIYLARATARGGQTFFTKAAAINIAADLRSDLHNHIISQDAAFFDKQKSGDLISKMTNDLSRIQVGLENLMAEGLAGPVHFIVLGGYVFYTNPLVACLSLTLVPLSAYVVSRMGRRVRSHAIHTSSKLSEMTSSMSESFSSMRFVNAYGLQDFVRRRFESTHDRLRLQQIKVAMYEAFNKPASELSNSLAAAAVFMIAGSQVASGAITSGELTSFVTALLLLYRPIRRFLNCNSDLQASVAAADRVFSVLDSKLPHMCSMVTTTSIPTSPLPIRLENVSFSYESSASPALHNINLSIPAGTLCVLAGPSGSGKTTLTNLIARLYEVSSGKIFIGDREVSSMSRASLIQQVSCVLQSPFVWSMTIAQNVRLGRPEASDEEVKEALQQSQLLEFVETLPMGMDTVIGSEGTHLSQGQMQRLSICRALVSQAPVLLFDESSSSLDNHTEEAFYDVLCSLKGKRTIVWVAHRLGIAPRADRVMFLQNGSMLEGGTHQELLQQKGSYFRLWCASHMQ